MQTILIEVMAGFDTSLLLDVNPAGKEEEIEAGRD